MTGKVFAKKRVVVSTEKWNTRKGEGYKAVVRNPNGTFDGATNQTRFVALSEIVSSVQMPRKKFLGIF
jgi:hypothetical protein